MISANRTGSCFNKTTTDPPTESGFIADILFQSGEMTMCESNADVEYILCASLRRSSALFLRSVLRRSISFPTGSLTRRE